MVKQIPKGSLVAFVKDFESGEFEDYYNALGRFVSKFSEVETNFLTALWHFGGLESPISQAVLSGVKIEGATGYINRIADAKGWTKKRRQRFKDFSDQLGLINKLRNDILHNGANWTGQQTWTVTNKLIAHTPSRIRTFPITVQLLKDAVSDLEKIENDLILFAWGHAMTKSTRRIFEEIRRKTWHYTPPPGFERPQKRRKTPRKKPTQSTPVHRKRLRDYPARHCESARAPNTSRRANKYTSILRERLRKCRQSGMDMGVRARSGRYNLAQSGGLSCSSY
jgi:hypothetical protein